MSVVLPNSCGILVLLIVIVGGSMPWLMCMCSVCGCDATYGCMSACGVLADIVTCFVC